MSLKKKQMKQARYWPQLRRNRARSSMTMTKKRATWPRSFNGHSVMFDQKIRRRSHKNWRSTNFGKRFWASFIASLFCRRHRLQRRIETLAWPAMNWRPNRMGKLFFFSPTKSSLKFSNSLSSFFSPTAFKVKWRVESKKLLPATEEVVEGHGVGCRIHEWQTDDQSER